MRTVPFTDVCDIQGGTQPPKSEWLSTPTEGYVRMLQIRDFTQPKASNIAFVKKKKSLKTCNTEDVLIGRYGASVGKILTGLSGAYNVAIAKCIFDPQTLNRDFLLFWLRGEYFQRKVVNFGGRAAQAGFNKTDLQQLQIPLPPLDEQKRIASILDAADALRAKRRQTLTDLDTLIQSTFLDMFGDPVTNPKGWEVKSFSEVAHSRLGKMLDKKKQTGLHLKAYLANFNVQWGRFILDDLREMDFNDADQVEFSLKRGDLLVCEGGEVGRCAVWEQDNSDVYFQKALHRCRLNSKYTVPHYAHYYFWFMAKNGGFKDFISTSTISHLTGAKLKKLPYPLPPLNLQQQFADIVDKIEAQKSRCQAHLDELDTLFTSLQSRAFKGEL